MYRNAMRLYKQTLKYQGRKSNVLFELNNNFVYLTFDDVPYSEKTTVAIVNALEKYNVHATFFIISDSLSKASPITLDCLSQAAKKKIIKVANHGHRDICHAKMNFSQVEDEIKNCDAILHTFGFNETEYYRPGCGFVSDTVYKVAEKLKKKIVLGSVYSGDPYIPIAWVHYVFIRWFMKLGDIVILHDRPWTPKLVEMLFRYLARQKIPTACLP